MHSVEGASARYDAGDVLVVGGGATGLLTAIALEEAGMKVTLLESEGLGAQQSNHSHGYLHLGYIYLAGTTDLVADLRDGSALWRERMKHFSIPAAVGASQILFSNPFSAQSAVAHWKASGLPQERQEPSPIFSGRREVVAAFRTGERSYDFSAVFRALAAQIPPGISYVAGTAHAVIRDEDARVVGVRAHLNSQDETVVLEAGRYVLAAGTENERLIQNATHVRGRAYSRTSYMMVLQSAQLPVLSYINPENESYGLFVSSRRHGHRVVWLVSNFLSYARLTTSKPAFALWTLATWNRLQELVDLESIPDLRVGGYVAPKMELRARPGVLSAHAAEDYELENVLVAAPTKLTLAPVLAQQIARDIGKLGIARPLPGATAIDDLVSAPSAGDEKWLSAPVMPVGEFLSMIREVRSGRRR
jgi:glycine/D-amino acid oxidase-like deaminating enzyme